MRSVLKGAILTQALKMKVSGAILDNSASDPTGPHRPIGPLQYRPIGIRPERPDGQSAPGALTVF